MAEKHVPMRRCMGCMKSFPRSELLRVVAEGGCARPDFTGRAEGRGGYICKSPDCLKKAEKKDAFRRNLGASMPMETLEMLKERFESLAKQKAPEVK